jgi:hypothetical protein
VVLRFSRAGLVNLSIGLRCHIAILAIFSWQSRLGLMSVRMWHDAAPIVSEFEPILLLPLHQTQPLSLATPKPLIFARKGLSGKLESHPEKEKEFEFPPLLFFPNSWHFLELS